MTALFDDFMVRALVAGVGLAIAAAPLGCLVVWRRMAFFGDATAHAAILGVALAFATSLPVWLGVLVFALAMAMLVSGLNRTGHAADTILGVLAHSALAAGLVAVSFLTNVQIDLMAFLFGDILAVSKGDITVTWAGGALIVGLVGWRWSRLLTVTISTDLATAAGIDPRREQFVLNLGLALTVAIAIKIVGALLIAAMLVIPAATARPLAGTPERMAITAASIGAVAVAIGLEVAMQFDTPAGPTIVCCLAVMFILSTALSAVRR